MRNCPLITTVLMSLLVACGATKAAAPASPQPLRAVPAYVSDIAHLEATYDYESYRATPATRRYDTTFFNAMKQLLAPGRHVAHSRMLLARDRNHALVLEQRAAIAIAQREAWTPLVPCLLQYLDYAESGLAAIPTARPWGERWQYPSMAVEAILSFDPDALPFLEESALDKRFRPELRLAALALMLQIDEQHAREAGSRLQGDAFLDPDRLNSVLDGSITAADIAYSLARTPKPPQPATPEPE